MTRILSAAALLMMTAAMAHAETVRFAVTDIEGMEQLHAEFGAFETALEEATGYQVDLFPVSSRTAAVEALNSGSVDLVLTGPAEYVVMKELSQPVIVTAWQRPDYFAQIVTLSQGPIGSVEDLKGKTIAFGSVGSTSQHLGPAQVLTDFGLAYDSDYRAQIINRNVAVEAMIRGDIAAVGMNRSHLEGIREAFPDTSFTVIARGRDLPNDILVARKDLDPAVIEKVKAAFVEQGPKLFEAVVQGEDNRKFLGGHFLNSVDDADYDYVRDMYRTIGVDTQAFVGD